jgi:hypothetical protein
MRVAVSRGTSPANPPDFADDNLSGLSTGFVNPGHRLAVDTTSGPVYSLFQRVVRVNADGSKNIDYTLNRSTDGGRTWGLNDSPVGVAVANGDSTQPTPKFGTVNALLGGVDHAAVDPATGDVYVVYGDRDAETGNNRLSIVRLSDDGAGGLAIGPSFLVTDQVQAALPSVAVASDGTVGVLYDTFDGLDDASGFPVFSAHLGAQPGSRHDVFRRGTRDLSISRPRQRECKAAGARRLPAAQGCGRHLLRRVHRERGSIRKAFLEHRSYFLPHRRPVPKRPQMKENSISPQAVLPVPFSGKHSVPGRVTPSSETGRPVRSWHGA